MKKKKQFNRYKYSMAVPALTLYTVFYIIPILLGFVMAFTNWNIRSLYSAQFTGLKNFIGILQDENFILSVKNTLLFAFFTTVLKVGFGLLLAMLMTMPFKTRNIMRSIYYLPAVLSTVVIGLLCSDR